MYNDIKLSYFGGVTEVYRPYGKNLYYYDVNSLYPYSALNPMPGLMCTYIDNINLHICDCFGELYGFYYCKITTTRCYLGLLPYRSENGGLLMPTGKFEGWYFSEQLKYAFENGYKIEIIKSYKFNKSYNVFDDYVNNIYSLKCNTNESVERSLAKSLLNNLISIFGMNIEKDITELVDSDKYNVIDKPRIVKGVKSFDDKWLVTYWSEISREKCEEYNVYSNHNLNNNLMFKGNKSVNTLTDVYIPIPASVTAYSRIYMNKIRYLKKWRFSILYRHRLCSFK